MQSGSPSVNNQYFDIPEPALVHYLSELALEGTRAEQALEASRASSGSFQSWLWWLPELVQIASRSEFVISGTSFSLLGV